MKTDDEIHAEALLRYEEASSAWSEHYEQIESDVEFLVGENHWDDGNTYNPKKIKLTINKCPSFVNNIINEMRASRPAIKFSPVDDKADVDTADILQGLARNTEAVSDAATAYDTSALFQVAAGLGFVRVNLDWVEGTFDQEPSIDSVDDVSTILIDPHSKKIDGHDMRYAFVTEDITKEQFEKEYPDAQPIDFGNVKPGWCSDKTVRVAEYYYKEAEVETLHLVSNGAVLRDVDLKAYEQSGLADQIGELQIVQSRKQAVDVVKWCKINGQEVLEKTDYVGKYIPIVPVYGNFIINRGKKHIFGLIKVLRDPQRMVNYWESSHTEVIALQPKAPWVAPEGQLEGREEMWKDANQKDYPFLEYKPTVIETAQGPIPAPPPSRQPPPQASSGMAQQAMMSSQYMKEVTGIFDASQGAESNETSGLAILARQRQGDTASYHYIDNQSKSIRMVGKILLDLYQKVYKGPQIKRILGEDGTEENIRLNQPTETMRDGQRMAAFYDLTAGRYDVSVNIGPSFASKRQEALEASFELARIMPQIMGVGADLIVSNIDAPGMEELSKRLKKALPPGMGDDEQSPEQIALAQASQAVEMLKAQLGALEGELNDKKRAENMKYDVDMRNAEIKQQEANIKAFEAQIEAYKVQAETNNIPAEAFQQIISAITSLKEQNDDLSGALSILLDADAGFSQPPDQESAAL